MRYLFGLVCALALGVMPLVGCSDSEGPAGSGGSAGSGGTAGSGGSGGGGNTASRFLTVAAFDPDGNFRLDGVELCELDTTNCVVSDADGLASLELPAEGETAYTAEKEGYAPRLFTEVISEDTLPLMPLLMLPEDHVAEEHERLGAPYPMQGTGTVFINIDPDLAGVTFDLLNATGTAWYLDEEITWSAAATGTTDLVDAVGGFTEVTPGVVEVKIGGTAAQGCTPKQGWLAEAENTVRVLVREGYICLSRLTCPVPP